MPPKQPYDYHAFYGYSVNILQEHSLLLKEISNAVIGECFYSRQEHNVQLFCRTNNSTQRNRRGSKQRECFYGKGCGLRTVHPFLKWPGGKRWLIANYRHIFPAEYNCYYEPFLGGGSAFFSLMPQQATISDINGELINTYRVMARNPVQLREYLIQHQEHHSEAHYYAIRAAVPNNAIERAARFLYLNRTCFNGMYRVNHLGEFNVPIGSKQQFTDDVALFEEYSAALRNIHIRKQDFVETIHDAAEGDLVFADPPYTIAHNQNAFIKYNEKLFSWKDQKRLLGALTRARDRGAIIIATNAHYPTLQRMYEDHHFYSQALHRFSSISGSADGRGTQEELLISSCPINLQEE